MKYKLSDILTCVLFCGFVGVMLVLFLVTPKADFSQLEKRALAEAPDTSMDAILSGAFGTQAETYIADHIPGRSFFVGVSNYYDLLSGRQGIKEILVAEDDRLVEAPNEPNDAAVQRNMNAINRFADTIGQQVDLMIVPSAGFVLEDTVLGLHGDYTDDSIIAGIHALAGERVRPVTLLDTFTAVEDPGALYYRTDHHWTTLGAYTAAKVYTDLQGKTLPDRGDYTVERFAGFYGTTHSRSGLWLTKPDAVELWDNGGSYTVTAYRSASDTVGTTSHSLFFRQRLQERDMYTVFLDGNQPLVRIQNPAGEGRLLVIRDSYANCLGTVLAGSYREVVLVDLRYWKSPVSDLVASQGFDDVLVCYSLFNFLNDVNFPWLK